MKPLVRKLLFFSIAFFLSACESQAVRENREIIRRQEEELDALRAENQRRRQESERERREEETYQACRRAFLSFEQAQVAKDPREAEALYREGLGLCPDDDVAHYELGRILADDGRRGEARQEFNAALNLNPEFSAAREALGKLGTLQGEK